MMKSSSRFVRIALMLALVFMIAPTVIVVINSFNASAFNQWPPPEFTLHWYARAFQIRSFTLGLKNSVIVALCATVASLSIGLPFSYAVTRYTGRFTTYVNGLLFGPMVVPRIALGFAFFVAYVGFRTHLYGTYSGLVLAHTVLTLPFSVSILGASLGEIDGTVEDAARDLGCSPFAAFWHGVMPQMKASLIVSALMAFITSFDEVEMSLFIAKNDTNPLPIAMYNYLDQYQDPTLSAISAVLIVISFSLALAAVFAMRGKSISKVISGGAV